MHFLFNSSTFRFGLIFMNCRHYAIYYLSLIGTNMVCAGRPGTTPSSSTSSSTSRAGTYSGPSHGPSVMQALEVARDSPEGAQDPSIKRILETALAGIWARIQAQPSSYVMTRDEFAVFNFYQDRFQGQRLAIAARKRYWDSW
jgi:hypothetical protein